MLIFTPVKAVFDEIGTEFVAKLFVVVGSELVITVAVVIASDAELEIVYDCSIFPEIRVART